MASPTPQLRHCHSGAPSLGGDPRCLSLGAPGYPTAAAQMKQQQPSGPSFPQAKLTVRTPTSYPLLVSKAMCPC